MYKQFSRDQWISLGDDGSKYFFSVMKTRFSTNHITILVNEAGPRLVKTLEIIEEVTGFYEGLMGSAVHSKPRIDINILRGGATLSHHQNLALCTDFSNEEILAALNAMPSDKAPGIDGFYVLFFKRTWGIIGREVCDVVKDFFTCGKMLKAINCATITLVPKCSNPSRIRDYRLIACCTTIYKLSSKILTNRMQHVIDNLVGKEQATFVPGRVISDNVILSHELVKSYTRKHVSPRCMIKVDIQKAYDSVEWGFIEQVLRGMGFPAKFISWIMICISTVSYRVFTNGTLAPSFVAKRDLRQGDPLSPYLFVLCMEYPRRSLKSLNHNPNFNFHPKCERLGITLGFAHDLLLFARGDIISVQLLHEKFMHFSEVSGFKANLSKSHIFFGGVCEAEKQNILRFLVYSGGQLPVKYLGVPLTRKELSIAQVSLLLRRSPLEYLPGWLVHYLMHEECN